MFYKYKEVNLHYQVIGEGKPVLLLHGMCCDMGLMKGCMEPVFEKKGGYRRIYLDLPGMGKSTAPREYASADKILEILGAFVREIIQERFLIAGESYGGYLARGVLERFYDRVDGLLLICPVVIPDHERRDVPQTDLKFVEEGFLDRPEAAKRREFLVSSVIADEQVFGRFQKEIQPGLQAADEEFTGILEKNYAFSRDIDKEIRTISFQKPVLFVCGRQDTCVGYRDLWGLLEDYPRATYGVLDTAGHNLQIEQPGLFEALAKEWLARTEVYDGSGNTTSSPR